MHRIERLINLIAALLDSDRPLTAAEIRSSIAGYDQASEQAFRRTFERDKADLKAIGIPIEVKEDAWGGAPSYTIPKARYYLPELDLEPDELAALRIAADAILGVEEEASAGLTKLSILTDFVGSPGRISWNVDLAADEPRLSQIYDAIGNHNVVRFAYRSAQSTEATRRTLEPYSLIHRRGQWYLVGRDTERGEVRTFKVSRIEGEVEVGEDRFEAPESFDPAIYPIDQIIGDERPESVTVRFSEKVAWWPRQSLPSAQIIDAPNGAVDVILPTTSFDAAASFVVWWGSDVEILAPPAAREHFTTRLKAFSGR